ncbi:MAG TPA: hypothetical protein P5119_07255 [Candidatus Aminicenantes bacterium]|nr:hypothetical protein [Candidatus Aminicenantes bacterium]HRY65126.1 hypothetical protein [Candidatus Aminicenantes bacterium]HRZ72406.1 hypothetical protein [Candidatus Aminicenantes bacterium]
MSNLLRTFENEVQLAALAFMGLVYALRLVWIFRFRVGRERTVAVGREGAGTGYSLMNIAMPWAMESTRTHPGRYLEFVVLHLGIAAAIAASFIIPYGPGLFETAWVRGIFRAFIAAAGLAGLARLARRLTNPVLREISSPDDYFSLVFLIVWLAAGVLALPDRPAAGEGPLLAFFGLTAFLLVYVPFSKIGHYLYYPFSRIYLGRTLGHRGAWPPAAAKSAGAGPARKGAA